jgi:hypothetical protein
LRCLQGAPGYKVCGTVPSYEHDLRYGRQVERAVQAIGGVAIVMEHPAGSRIAHNLHNGRNKLPLAFTDM